MQRCIESIFLGRFHTFSQTLKSLICENCNKEFYYISFLKRDLKVALKNIWSFVLCETTILFYCWDGGSCDLRRARKLVHSDTKPYYVYFKNLKLKIEAAAYQRSFTVCRCPVCLQTRMIKRDAPHTPPTYE